MGSRYNYVNVGLYFAMVKQTPDYFKMPQFHNGDANFRIKTKNGGMFKYYTTFAFSDLGLRRPDIDSNYLKDAFSLKNRNWYNNLSYRENIRPWLENDPGRQFQHQPRIRYSSRYRIIITSPNNFLHPTIG